MVAKRQASSFDPSRPDFAPYGLTCVNWSPSRMRRADHHNEVELNFLESGSVTYLLGGRKTVVGVGRLGVFWGAIPHQIIDFSSGTVYFVATIPVQCFLEWRLPEDFVQPIMQGQFLSEPTTARAESDELAFARWEAELRPDAPELERAALLEMQARLIRLARELPACAKARSSLSRLATISDTELSRAEQMACFIAQHYTEKLSAAQIG
jgi:hypothetical protein